MFLLLALACPPPPTAATPDPPVREVHVVASSRVNVAPDEAVITLVFSATSATMKRSHAASTGAVVAFREALTALAIPADALELCGTTDAPEHRYDSGQQRIVGYSSSTTLNVRTKDFERVADIVDAAVASGVTHASVSYHSTTLPEHKQRARELAIAAAKEKAAQLAVGLGAKLGEVRTISEGQAWQSGSYSPNFAGNAFQAEVTASSDEGPVTPGTTPLDLSIDVTFALE
jgi:uncharacterized protein YggE